jgi:hypothetical protein
MTYQEAGPPRAGGRGGGNFFRGPYFNFLGALNQRPIGRIPNDPDDGSYLCPNDMLLGRPSSNVPQGTFKATKNPRDRVEFVQRIVDSFWVRWTTDVLPVTYPKKEVERRS